MNKKRLLVAKLHTALGVIGVILSILFGVATWFGHMRGNEPEDVGIILDVISGMGALGSLLFFSVLIFVGRAVKNMKYHAFCIIVSALLCLCIPFGTMVGVYSLYVLMKEDWTENDLSD